MQILQRQIDVLKANQGGVPVGAVMFFDLPRCPTGWDFVGNENRPNSVKWLACRKTNN